MTANGVNPSDEPLFTPCCVAKGCCDGISAVVLPILLIFAVALTIYYALNPVGHIFVVTSNFSLSVPVIVCSSLGIGIAILLSVQMRRLVKFSQKQVRQGLHCGPFQIQNKGSGARYQTRDGIELEGLWQPISGTGNFQSAPTAILFHANGCTKEGMQVWGHYYRGKGFNVFLAEYRGYQQNTGVRAGPNQEMEAYLDAEAALKFVLDQGVKREKVLAHGLSLGGAYAASLGYFYGIQHVVLEQTFTSFSAVAVNVVRSNAPRPRNRLLVLTSTCFFGVIQGGAWFLAHTAYQSARLPACSTIPDSRRLKTDRFSTLNKVRRMQGEIFVIHAANDNLMPGHFGLKLVRANYGDRGNSDNRLTTIGGGHCSDQFFRNQAAQLRFDNYLRERDLLAHS
ncbi:MAG: hypothetical protein S4CHLAM2_02590 [Chlamydiales bacterium]|nr:hypothetical protein [Chlamydiales bacterium]